MTTPELNEIVEQQMANPAVLGRLACNLRADEPVLQRHHDGGRLTVEWTDHAGFWRCIVFSDTRSNRRLAQVDLHDNGTVRAEVFEPCRLTISPEEGILCLTRYKSVAQTLAGAA